MSQPVTETLPRDRHLFGPGPKRILSLDGGGVRGAVSLAFLERMESLLSTHCGKPVRLGDWFDLIGGTSTGAIIAGGLALGYSAREVWKFYQDLAPHAFKRTRFWVPVLRTKFDVEPLRREIEKVIGARTLDSPDLITGLCIITKRLDTGSPWILCNNPKAPYWNDTPESIGNKRYRLASLVRASTAAPTYFIPEIVDIMAGEPGKGDARPDRASTQGLFVDGGVSPYNNPAIALLHLAWWRQFGLCWTTGPGQLSLISIGTGTFKHRMSLPISRLFTGAKLLRQSLLTVVADAQRLALAQLQWMGECRNPWQIDTDVGTVADNVPPGGKLFRFARYDVLLEREWLKDKIGRELSAAQLAQLRAFDRPENAEALHEIGRIAAEQQVQLSDLIPAPQ